MESKEVQQQGIAHSQILKGCGMPVTRKQSINKDGKVIDESTQDSCNLMTPKLRAELLEKLNNMPNVRPEKVARGQLLVQSETYPDDDVLSQLAGSLLNENYFVTDDIHHEPQQSDETKIA